ncbi:MAG: NADPH:quinone oxidoreductase family protein [Paracoccaceae bacterium]
MIAFRVQTAGEPPQIVEIEKGIPDPGQVLVEIKACGLNFADLLMQRGTYQDTPDAPFTLGMEVAGIVRQCGVDVAALQPGDRVMVYARQGGLATFGVFDSDRVLKMPDDMSFEQAAAFQIGYGTAHMALSHRAGLLPGETLLVTGAGGGTGLTAVEVGAQMGARVIAAARGSQKLNAAKAAGATEVIDTGEEDLRTRLLDLGRADVVYDTVGGDLFKSAFRAMKPEGRLLPVGFAGGDVPQIPANHLLVKNLTVIGFYIGGYLNFRADVVRDSFATLTRWFEEGRLTPHIGHVLPLERVSDGMDLLRDRKAVGKVVITP